MAQRVSVERQEQIDWEETVPLLVQKEQAAQAPNSDGRPDQYLNSIEVVAEILRGLQESVADISRNMQSITHKLSRVVDKHDLANGSKQ